MNQQVQAQQQQNPFQMMAGRLSVDPDTVQNIMVQTLMKAKGGNAQVSHEELMVFMSIANEYRLNPLAKEIYAVNNRGAIPPIVSIDGWLKIINSHPQFDGMEFNDHLDGQGQLTAITCKIYRKDRARPTEVTEYLGECKGTSAPWEKWPARMLRHKATIQCARYAFGLSGIIDEDEADRIKSTMKDVSQEPETPSFCPPERFQQMLEAYGAVIESGQRSAESMIKYLENEHLLSEDQKQTIRQLEPLEVAQ